jgi:hypothetical protein
MTWWKRGRRAKRRSVSPTPNREASERVIVSPTAYSRCLMTRGVGGESPANVQNFLKGAALSGQQTRPSCNRQAQSGPFRSDRSAAGVKRRFFRRAARRHEGLRRSSLGQKERERRPAAPQLHAAKAAGFARSAAQHNESRTDNTDQSLSGYQAGRKQGCAPAWLMGQPSAQRSQRDGDA